MYLQTVGSYTCRIWEIEDIIETLQVLCSKIRKVDVVAPDNKHDRGSCNETISKIERLPLAKPVLATIRMLFQAFTLNTWIPFLPSGLQVREVSLMVQSTGL